MQVSRELDYGVRAMVVMASHLDEVISKRRIAESFDIPINFLAIILPKLVHSHLVESLPGPRGGYRLAKPPKYISLYDVVCAINHGFDLNLCDDTRRVCKVKQRCPVAPHWAKLTCDIKAYLKTVTFDSLVEVNAEVR